MNKIILFLVISLVILYGCQQAATKPEPAAPAADAARKETALASEPKAEAPQPEIPSDIKELLSKSKTKLTSYSYRYTSPEGDVSIKISVKGNKTRIDLPSIINLGGKIYNTIYLDTAEKKAEAYCVGYSNCGNNLGKIADLSYAKSYIETPVDWLAKVTEASKLGEEMMENKASLKISTNIGIIWVEKYYGFLYKIQDGENIYSFSDAAFNAVADSEVTP